MSSNHEDAMTKPTLETILERINNLGDNLQGQISGLRKDFDSFRIDVGSLKTDVGSLKTDFAALRDEFQLFRGEVEIRLDRIEGMTNQTRSEFLNFRADFKELSARVS